MCKIRVYIISFHYYKCKTVTLSDVSLYASTTHLAPEYVTLIDVIHLQLHIVLKYTKKGKNETI